MLQLPPKQLRIGIWSFSSTLGYFAKCRLCNCIAVFKSLHYQGGQGSVGFLAYSLDYVPGHTYLVVLATWMWAIYHDTVCSASPTFGCYAHRILPVYARPSHTHYIMNASNHGRPLLLVITDVLTHVILVRYSGMWLQRR